MRALFLKDWYMAKSYCRSYLLVILVFAGVSLISSESLFFAAYPSMMAGILPVTLISYDERFRWTTYAGALPISRRDEVREKYLLSLLLAVAVGAFMVAAQAASVKGRGVALNEGFAMMIVGTFAFSLLGPCVLLPLSFRFGSEKARMYFYVFVILVAIVSGVTSGMSQHVEFPFKTLYLVILAAVVALFPISYVFACRSYEKREF